MNIPHYVSSLSLGSNSKVDLILAALGHIPTAEIRFYKGNSNSKKVAHSLRMAGLFVTEIKPNPKAKYISILCVSQTKINVESLAHLITFRETQGNNGKKKDSTFHALYGVLMGYPLTAIDAFIRRSNLKLDELPEEFDGHPMYRFMPSKNHWQSELTVINEWRKVIEEVAPHIIKQLQPE